MGGWDQDELKWEMRLASWIVSKNFDTESCEELRVVFE
jgi:hypothetical protein